jgi:hypothetical protein
MITLTKHEFKRCRFCHRKIHYVTKDNVCVDHVEEG